MAYETEAANIIHATDTVAAVMTEAFQTIDNTFVHCLTEVFPDDTNVIKFAKSGSLSAAGLSESTAWTYDSGDEVTDSATTITGVKKAQAQKITVENMRFGGRFASMERYGRMHANALAALAASELKTLFSSISNSVTATSTLTLENLMDARYSVTAAAKDAFTGRVVAWLDHKGVNEIRKDLLDSAASAYVAQVDLGILGTSVAGQPDGTLYDIVIYATDGLPTSSSDDVACVWDPGLAFAAGIDGINGFNVFLHPPRPSLNSVGGYWELFTYTFWHIAIHNNTAACKLLSDT